MSTLRDSRITYTPMKKNKKRMLLKALRTPVDKANL